MIDWTKLIETVGGLPVRLAPPELQDALHGDFGTQSGYWVAAENSREYWWVNINGWPGRPTALGQRVRNRS